MGLVERPSKFEDARWIGDKRTLVVYDIDNMTENDTNTALIDELMEAGTYLSFGPDTLAEARNRGFRAYKAH